MKHLLFIVCILASITGEAQDILSQREQVRLIDELLEDRLKDLLPTLMRREGIDLWLIVSREYNEDPVIKTLLPATWMAARRTTMLMAFDRGEGKDPELLAVSRYNVGNLFKSAWDPEREPDQWTQLARLIEERNPKKIGVNTSEKFALADGISATELEMLKKKVHKKFAERIVSAESLAVAWLETRSDREMAIYPDICRIAHTILREGLSENVIRPGITTTDDLTWWYREKIRDMKLDTWFHPSVSIQRNEPEAVFLKRPASIIIMPGDLLHVDFGITYLRLNTDMQEHAYVLKADEAGVPEFLKNGLAQANKLQDILTENFQNGKSGNEILRESRKQALDQGIKPSIYTHPIGFHGHAAGAMIGLWDMQGGVPYTGDYTIHPRTAWSIELNVTIFSTEWKKDVRIMLEEDGYFDENGFRYIDGRQTEFLTIPRPGKKF